MEKISTFLDYIRGGLQVGFPPPAKKIAPADKFLPVFDWVVKENSGRY
jgi:hypothetical protein